MRCSGAHWAFLGVKYGGPQGAPSPRCGSILGSTPICPDVTRVRSVASLRVSASEKEAVLFFSPDTVASHQITASGIRVCCVRSITRVRTRRSFSSFKLFRGPAKNKYPRGHAGCVNFSLLRIRHMCKRLNCRAHTHCQEFR